MKADEAFKISMEHQYNTHELKRILESILKWARQGKTEILDSNISSGVMKALLELGYKIETYSGRFNDTDHTISWEK